MGTQSPWHAQTVQLAAGAIDVLFDRQVFEGPSMTDSTGATGSASLLVFGDFSNFVIARRAGLVVETVPHLLGHSGRPTGERGVFAFARVGANVVDDNAFRILVDA